MALETRKRIILLFCGLVLLPQLNNQAKADNHLKGCSPAKPGRYVVMGTGSNNGVPIARLMLEEWNSNGLVNGTYFKRVGQDFNEGAYTGNWKDHANCVVSINRITGDSTSNAWAIVNQQGMPSYSISSTPKTVLTMKYFNQGKETCSANTLNGVILSQQKGLSYAADQWLPNVVVQREVWGQGRVKGLALSSYDGKIESLDYSGTINAKPNCTALIKEVDSLGVPYTYKAIILSGGRGYIYLQTQGKDLTLGLLEKEN